MRLDQLVSKELNEETYDMEGSSSLSISYVVEVAHDPKISGLIEQVVADPAFKDRCAEAYKELTKQLLGNAVAKAQSDVDIGDRWLDDARVHGNIYKR